MAKDPASLFYIDKWISATQGMKGCEKGWYLDMILFQYDKGPLPNDIDELASICRIRPSEFNVFEQVFEQVLKQKFIQNSEGKLENEFAREIIKGRQMFLEKRSNAGKMSYLSRYMSKELRLKKNEIDYVKKSLDVSDLNLKDEQVFKQVLEQISELLINANTNVNKDININNNTKALWRENTDDGYREYLRVAEAAFDELYDDWKWIKRQKEFYPNVSVRLTLDKMWEQFWGTKAGWKNKRQKRTNEINWKSTIQNNFKMSAVYIPRGEPDKELTHIEMMKRREENEAR